jgi:tripeptide aminopeptidase
MTLKKNYLMINFNEHLAIELFSIQTKSGNEAEMKIYISKYANDLGANVEFDKKGNLYVTKGKAKVKPCIASHMDTVHSDVKEMDVFSRNGRLIALDENSKRTGVGGDDRCGIYVALEMLRVLDDVKAVFFVEEETGCKGSNEANLDWFKDVSFVLQCDRKGYGTMVTKASNKSHKNIDLVSEDFSKDISSIISSYGVETGDGGSTDVVKMKTNGLEVSVANIECGYYLPHSKDEYVEISEFEDVMNMVHSMCVSLGDKKYHHKWEKPAPVQYSSTHVYLPRVNVSEMVKKIYEGKWGGQDFSEESVRSCALCHEDVEIETIDEHTGVGNCKSCMSLVETY